MRLSKPYNTLNINNLQHCCVIIFDDNNDDSVSARYDPDIASQDIVGARVTSLDTREYMRHFKISFYRLSQGVSFAVSDPSLSPAAAMATQAVSVPPDSHAFVGKLYCLHR